MSEEQRSGFVPVANLRERSYVGLFTCQMCGAVVANDPNTDESALDLHEKWHRNESVRTMFGGPPFGGS